MPTRPFPRMARSRASDGAGRGCQHKGRTAPLCAAMGTAKGQRGGSRRKNTFSFFFLSGGEKRGGGGGGKGRDLGKKRWVKRLSHRSWPPHAAARWCRRSAPRADQRGRAAGWDFPDGADGWTASGRAALLLWVWLCPSRRGEQGMLAPRQLNVSEQPEVGLLCLLHGGFYTAWSIKG